MSESQKQMLVDVTNIIATLDIDKAKSLTKYAEKLIDLQLLSLDPDVLLENMDITEKIMLIKILTKTEEERQKDRDEAIPLEEVIKEMGLAIDDLQD